MVDPKVSVVMSVYNGERFLKEAVDSILGQTFNDFEFVIIDDGSTDSSWQVLEGYDDPRITLVHNPTNLGQSKSLNIAIEKARGEYVAHIDQDDVSLPTRLAEQVESLDKNEDITVVGSSCYVIDEKGAVTGMQYYFTEDDQIKKGLSTLMLAFCHSSIMARRKALLDVGLYNEDTRFAEDAELFVHMGASEKNKFSNLPTPLCRYRKHRYSLTSLRATGQLPTGWEPSESARAAIKRSRLILRDRYRDLTISKPAQRVMDDPRYRKAVASRYFMYGSYAIIRYGETTAARKAFLVSIKYDPFNLYLYIAWLTAAILPKGFAKQAFNVMRIVRQRVRTSLLRIQDNSMLDLDFDQEHGK